MEELDFSCKMSNNEEEVLTVSECQLVFFEMNYKETGENMSIGLDKKDVLKLINWLKRAYERMD